ncbi:MAG: KpsF/GutQ family sugar-phosphate isomerase [Salinivirgaceae bacterium]|nr:KpsF/GutQ family sugar-phosphate isomerase [Salinivirgaceae bacterium]MDD4746410.1 KpsF/GutQ family sugar-phosphate isomerase [Salinivirgaceae bacterium]
MDNKDLSFQEIKSIAVETINAEARSIQQLGEYIDDDFAKSVQLIIKSLGRVIVTGIGKSANIAGKIVATLNSTGTPAIFMHAADAIHGDLGIIQPNDIVICISKSGNTPEIKVLVPLIKRFGNKLIALVSSTDSFLAKQADLVLKATVEKEACPNNLAPTSSTTAQLVLGDALAICLLRYRGFGSSDFAKYHPGGALGKKLYMRVEDIYKNNPSPKVFEDALLNEIIVEISSNRLGATAVVTNQNKLSGVITDGDLRRMLQTGKDLKTISAKEFMSKNPKTIDESEMAINAFHIMEKNSITQLIVTKGLNYAGIIHIHDIIREGIV